LKQKLQFPFVLLLKTTDQLDGHTSVNLPSEYSWMDTHIG